jgi:hypothetical protein
MPVSDGKSIAVPASTLTPTAAPSPPTRTVRHFCYSSTLFSSLSDVLYLYMFILNRSE